MKPTTKLANDSFLLATFAFWCIAAGILIFFSKAEIHLYLNELHSPFFDQFFKYATYMGDGTVVVLCILVLAFFRVRYGIFALVGYLGSGLIAQVLKRFVFRDVKRPLGFFDGIADLHLVPGVDVHTSKSFPSGHTTTAFAFFACLALLTHYKPLRLFLFVLALLGAYSRIYLSQHFLVDVFAGSIIGTATTYALKPFFMESDKAWMEYSLKDKLF